MAGQRVLDDENVARYLRDAGVVATAAALVVEAAGDGNINWVRRVRAPDGRSWIVKQARGTLERFPQYAADPVRLVYEARYLETARRHDRDAVLPAVHHFDEANRVLVLEDAGDAPRMGELLQRGRDLTGPLEVVVRFLARVHRAGADAGLVERFANQQMRRLHGDHIFYLPFRANDFDLDPTVAERARAMWGNENLRRRADRWYERYLEASGALVHGDVQSSNILIAERRPVLLDAEIAHVGDPAFDVGTLVAHVYLPAVAGSELARARATTRHLLAAYSDEHAASSDLAAGVEAYAAIEMMRRTIGAARHPAMAEVEAALRCLDLAEAALSGEEHLVG